MDLRVLKWNFDSITENSYCNLTNLSVIIKKTYKYDKKFKH